MTPTIGWLLVSLFFAVGGGVLGAALVHRSMPAGADATADRDS